MNAGIVLKNAPSRSLEMHLPQAERGTLGQAELPGMPDESIVGGSPQ